MEDWVEDDVEDDIESIYSEDIEEEVFSPDVLEETDRENKEWFFNYYLRDLERIESRLKNLGIKKFFKTEKTSPFNLKNTELQKSTCIQTMSLNKSSVTLRELENSPNSYSIKPIIDISHN